VTTHSWTQSYEHNSDAQFRAWGSALSAKLQAYGLVQTADTGQIDWVTVTRPTTNGTAGYEIFYLNDSLHATSPIYLKISYGTGGVTNVGRMTLQTGTGTNGSGTLTGAVSAARSWHHWGNTAPNGNAKSNWIAHGEGYISVLISFDAQALNAEFGICRTCDSSGTPTGDGFALIYGGAQENGIMCTRSIATATAFATSTNAGVVPGGVSSSLVDGTDPQVYVGYGILPRVWPVFSICGFVQTEFNTAGTTFTATIVGSTPRTYISPGQGSYNCKIWNGGNAGYGTAFLYE
jgi:hypothetical protein